MTGEGNDDDWETGPWSFGGLLWERRLGGLIKRLAHRPPRGALLQVLIGVPLAVLIVAALRAFDV